MTINNSYFFTHFVLLENHFKISLLLKHSTYEKKSIRPVALLYWFPHIEKLPNGWPCMKSRYNALQTPDHWLSCMSMDCSSCYYDLVQKKLCRVETPLNFIKDPNRLLWFPCYPDALFSFCSFQYIGPFPKKKMALKKGLQRPLWLFSIIFWLKFCNHLHPQCLIDIFLCRQIYFLCEVQFLVCHYPYM